MARTKRIQGRATKKKTGNTITLSIDEETKAIINSKKHFVNWSEWFRERIKYEHGGQTTPDQEKDILKARYVQLQERLQARIQEAQDELGPQIQAVAKELSKKVHGIEVEI